MNSEDKKTIYNALTEGRLEVLSVTRDKILEWQPVLEVLQHDVSKKKQLRVSIDDVFCEVTEDHSLFIDRGEYIEPIKTEKFVEGDDLVFINEDKVSSRGVTKLEEVDPVQYMYDLSVKKNHDFVLKSGILAHNSFRPPESEKFIQGQTQVFGFIWEDEELIEYIYMAVDDFNSRPPTTSLTLDGLWGTERRWRTSVILRAAAFACFAIAMNWIANEFSVDGRERITIKDAEGNDYSVTMEELHDIIYGDILEEMKRRAKEECAEALKEIENEVI